MVTALGMGWGTCFETVVGRGFDGERVTLVLLELEKKSLRVGDVGVAVVARCFGEDGGRLDLYHFSASGSVLNFLNLAPAYPWTCDWASSLQTFTVQPHI